jgi:hypothetical protein
VWKATRSPRAVFELVPLPGGAAQPRQVAAALGPARATARIVSDAVFIPLISGLLLRYQITSEGSPDFEIASAIHARARAFRQGDPPGKAHSV